MSLGVWSGKTKKSGSAYSTMSEGRLVALRGILSRLPRRQLDDLQTGAWGLLFSAGSITAVHLLLGLHSTLPF